MSGSVVRIADARRKRQKRKLPQGIYVFSTKAGERHYRIRFADQHGIRRKETSGTVLRDAKALLEQRRVEVRQKTYRPPSERGLDGAVFENFAEKFLDGYASEKRSTFYSDMIFGRRKKEPAAIIRYFGAKTLQELETDLAAFDDYRRLRLQQVSASSVRKELSVLCVMLAEARRLGLVKSNPLLQVDKPSAPKPDEAPPLTREEIEGTLREIEARDPWLAPIFRFALLSGLRLKEIALLTWDRIDLENRLAKISADNKVGRPREVPLGEVALGIFEAIEGRDETVFRDERGEPLDGARGRNRISQRTRAAMKRAGVDPTSRGEGKKGKSFKSTRTTVSTILAERGVSDFLVGRLLDHAWAKREVTHRHDLRIRSEALRPLIREVESWLGWSHIGPSKSGGQSGPTGSAS